MPSRPRVLYFSSVAYFKGGAERSLMDLVANPGVEPHVLVPDRGPILDKMNSLGIPTSTIDFGAIENVHRPFNFLKGLAVIRSTLSAVRSLIHICRQHRIDVVHSNGLKSHVIGAIACRIGGPPAVAHIRDIPLTRAEMIVWTLLRLAANQLILVSRACWRSKDLPNNVIVIHNGVVTASIERQPFRPASPLRIGFIGRIDAAKGLHLLLDWASEARQANLGLDVFVRGRFDSSDPKYQDQIGTQIAKLDLQDHIHLQGFVSDPDAVYSDIDVVCVPSHVPDPLPRSVMEPMARGIPVLAYPAGGILEMIENRRTGFLISNAAEFIAAVRLIISDKAAVENIAENAQDKIDTEFSLTRVHSNINAIYQTLLSR
jgi:glycosyltransferase involved in cell wall biosynthesis